MPGFLTVRHIDDVLPHIEGRPEFVVKDYSRYRSIDYNYVTDGSFDDPMRLECRGIKFDWDGSIIARPLHKFFNVGERPDTMPETIDLSKPHVITEKLDGSMVHAAFLGGELRLMTRAGITETSQQAENLLTDKLTQFCERSMVLGYTPIFEYTGPENRVVLRYETPQLTLLASRRINEGVYKSRNQLLKEAAHYGIPVAGESLWLKSTSEFIDHVRDLGGVEGFVISFDDGRMVKLKSLDYVLKHRAKSDIASEKNVLSVLLSGGLDDLLPLLDASDAENVLVYASDVASGLAATAANIEGLVAEGDGLSQKDFALHHLSGLDNHTRAMAFRVRNGEGSMEVVRSVVAKNAKTQTQVELVRGLFNARYREPRVAP